MKAFRIILVPLLIACALSGCMRESNLKDLTIIEGVAIDKKKDKIEITIQSLNVANSTGTEKPQGNMTVNTTQTGATIVDAISNLSGAVSKELFFGQNKLIIFGKAVCENDFSNQLDYLLRFTGSRSDVNVCMVDGGVDGVIDNTEDDSHVPTESLVYLISNGERMGTSVLVNINDILNAYLDKTSDMYLPAVRERDDGDNSELFGIAIFDDDRLVHILNQSDTLGFALINNELDGCFFEFNDEKLGVIGVELEHLRIKKYMSLNDNELTFNVKIKSNIVITELERGVINKINADDIARLSTLAEARLSEIIGGAFNTCQAYNSDALRVGETLARDYPNSYEKLSNNWDEAFGDVKLSPHIELKFSKLGDNIQMD